MIKYLLNALLLLVLALLVYRCTPSKTHRMPQLNVAFFNVENLFDTVDDPSVKDEEFLPGSAKKWTSARYNAKIDHLSRVVKDIFEDQNPGLLGLCEVENEHVTQDLVDAVFDNPGDCEIIQFDSPDSRGIDNVLVYQKARFRLLFASPIHVYFAEAPTLRSRDILYVKGLVNGVDTLHVFVNHFPSRLGGLKKSEPHRITVAKKQRHLVDSLLQINAKSKILIMGDFNDEPSNKSIERVLDASSRENIENGQLYDAMGKFDERGQGSYRYRDEWDMLDQFIISKGLLKKENSLHFVPDSQGIFVKDWMLQDETAGKYEGYPWRTYAGNKYLGGYSDHLPIFLKLSEDQ